MFCVCVCVCFESNIYRDGDIVNLKQVMADVTKELKYDQNNVTNYIYVYTLDQFSSGHQGRTRSDPHWPQVSVPLISDPWSATERAGPLPYEESGSMLFGALWPSRFFLSRDRLTFSVCHVPV